MTPKSLSDRVAALETKVGDKTIEKQFREQAELIDGRLVESFREQAELIDRLFIYRFDEFEKKLDAKFEAKLESKLEEKLQPIRTDIALIKNAVLTILGRLN